MPLLSIPTLIYSLALFFWFRYLYQASIKNAENRIHFIHSLKRILLFIPLGLQGILLSFLAVGQIVPLSISVFEYSGFILFGSMENTLPDFGPIRILFVGSLLGAIQLFLLKLNCSAIKKGSSFRSVLIFIVSIFFLDILIANVRSSLSFFQSPDLVFNYNNFYLWLLCFLLVAIFAFLKGHQFSGKYRTLFKYLALTSRILLTYLLLIVAMALPLMIGFCKYL